MDADQFWQIVEKIGWPNMHYDDARYWFMQNYSKEEAEEFLETFLFYKNRLNKAAGDSFCCDSWDDTTAHIIGLGKREYDRNIENPRLIFEREQKSDYRESFAYCIPHSDDYAKLTDAGYDLLISETQNELNEIETADEDDIPPKIYRQFPKVMKVCRLLIDKRWNEAVETYHDYFGPGYADQWPLHSYLIPNFVSELKKYGMTE